MTPASRATAPAVAVGRVPAHLPHRPFTAPPEGTGLPRPHGADELQLVAVRRPATRQVRQATLTAHEAIGDRDLAEPRICDHPAHSGLVARNAGGGVRHV